jgi:hypothetical protein
MRTPLIAGAALALSACATAGADSPDPDGNSADRSVCLTTMLEQFKDRPADAQLGSEVLRASGARMLQWVAHGMMVTMDFREDRVRIWLDEQNRVSRVSCG